MLTSLLRRAAPFLLFLLAAAPAAALGEAPIAPADMMRHIEVLASDDYEGRLPGTRGETLTVSYIARELQARGLEPAGPEGSWYQPVGLVERSARSHRVRFAADGRALPVGDGDIMLRGRDSAERVEGAPVYFAGHGATMAEQGIDQLAGADLRGAVVLILLGGPEVPGFPSFMERVRNVAEAGAAAVVAILDPDVAWNPVARNFGQRATRLDSDLLPPIIGAMPFAAAERLIAASGGDMARLLDEQPGSSFRAVALPIRVDMEVATEVRRYVSHNVVGRLRGSGGTGESVLYLAHWDHLGICRPEGVENRICNGAVDNASGIAMLIEIAGRLAQGPRPERDMLFLATTAEEMGLLGAAHFGRRPTVPTESIVAALNIDTVAVHPAGAPVAVIGRGIAGLDALIAETAAAMGRTMDTEHAADSFLQRQDGWALMQAGIPAVMVGGSFADMEALAAFLSGPYHKPEDDLARPIPLDGAAEDANLLVALGRRLADPRSYNRPDDWRPAAPAPM